MTIKRGHADLCFPAIPRGSWPRCGILLTDGARFQGELVVTDSGVARVDSASGWVRAVRPVVRVVVAASGEWRDSMAIVVRPPAAQPLGRASVCPSVPTARFRLATTVMLAAHTRWKRGSLAGAEVAWSSTESRLAAVDAERTGTGVRSPAQRRLSPRAVEGRTI